MSEKLVPKRQYTDEFKVEAIRLAESVGQHGSRASARSARSNPGQLEPTESQCRLVWISSTRSRATTIDNACTPLSISALQSNTRLGKRPTNDVLTEAPLGHRGLS